MFKYNYLLFKEHTFRGDRVRAASIESTNAHGNLVSIGQRITFEGFDYLIEKIRFCPIDNKYTVLAKRVPL